MKFNPTMKDYYKIFEQLSKHSPNEWISHKSLEKGTNLFLSDLQELAKQGYLFQTIDNKKDKEDYQYKLAPKGFETLQQRNLTKWNYRVGVFTIITAIATIIALIVAITSIYITIDSVYGEAKLRLEYTVGGDFNYPIKVFYFHDDQIGFQFLVKNVGHGSTAYTVEPQLNCENCNFMISFNGDEFKNIGTRPVEVHTIAPKSTQFIMVRFEDITEEEAGKQLQVLVRNLETNEHFWLNFEKNNKKITDFWFKLRQQ